ncbi:MAG: Deoxyribodipyrimidine photolyase, type II [Candidatus Ozemobacter sibiricus]|uniref:Deoxyribodipyrimidine photo-lyase n=1 Tax=Candidatus Ozemobacter sibiricus TaxID=2268124 RepID=A0A367ZLR7_9BACT|nr:MAG: Deoxyribodipyrimidine photolyase, type II [Candidatus Ozemobacter sibiricus]
MKHIGDPARRARLAAPGADRPGAVVYWMSRDQRVDDNWALLHASALARARRAPLQVVFTLDPAFPDATRRAWDFLLRGLIEVEADLRARGIPFHLLLGAPPQSLALFCRQQRVGCLVTDFSPLRHKRVWQAEAAAATGLAVTEVDAHNIVPAWIASPKQEFAARTLRLKLNRILSDWLEEFPALEPPPSPGPLPPPTDWAAVQAAVAGTRAVPPVEWLRPGPVAARDHLRRFVTGALRTYALTRNDPCLDGTSNLSPYLHFGHLAPQRAALAAGAARVAEESRLAFLEELVVRRELSDNFCLYNPHYDSPAGYPDWAKKTLALHAADRREHLYDEEAFEAARTHDELWNAAQRQMVRTGKMHGYLRMYWAKKLLEWTPSVAEAHRIALALNDRYELDGRDPNGYVGVAWSLGGVHDRPWSQRPIFGTIRYMSFGGCRSKFRVAAFIARWPP